MRRDTIKQGQFQVQLLTEYFYLCAFRQLSVKKYCRRNQTQQIFSEEGSRIPLFPINIIGYTIILIKLLGWPGLAGVFLTIILAPVLKKLSEINGELFQDISRQKDKRIDVTTQILEGMKYIKSYCWENVFYKRVEKHREAEIGLLRKYSLVSSVERAIGSSISNFTSLLMYFLSYYYDTGLTLTKILSTLQAISILDYAFGGVPLGFSVWYQINVVFQRFATLFNFKNTQMIKIDEQKLPSRFMTKNSAVHNQKQVENGSILFENFTSYWNQDFKNPTLTNINLSFKKGKLYGITGKVGAGKSSILAAILSEIPYYSGNISHKGSIAYVEQEPVIFSDTVKNNIIFGANYQKNKYERALESSCLINDISSFEKGQQTIVGEKGTTLSGGQKIRLSLARAFYTNADIYLLDDPISGVDSKVAKKINSNIVKHLSKQKTVVLVTHQIDCLYTCDEVIILNQGKIVAKGTPSQLKSILNQLNQQKDTPSEPSEAAKSLRQIKPRAQLSNEMSILKKQIKRDDCLQKKNEDAQVSNRFAEKEVAVNVSTYVNFFKSNKWNYALLPLTILLLICSKVILLQYYRVLSQYESVKQGTQLYFASNFNLFWSICILLLISNLFIGILKYFCLNMCILNSSQNIHKMMLKSVLRSPMRFFDKTPSGILTNKFTNDLGIVDNSLIQSLYWFIQGPISTMVTLITICRMDYNLAIFMILLILAITWFCMQYNQVLVLCKQLFLQSKNELVHFFRQSMAGMTQIRILGQRKNQLKEVSSILNNELKAIFGYQITSKGFTFYICLIMVAFLSITLFYLLYFITPAKVANFGLCVFYLTYLTETTQFYIRQGIATDVQMVSTQRLLDFRQLESQKDLQTVFSSDEAEVQLQKRCNKSIKNTKIEFKNYSGRYRQDLPLSLKNLNFSIQQGQRIGIVGRTGAGKSSIIQALFRILQPEFGSLYQIGGENALQMGLHSLRKQFGIIPQTPFIFKGSVRYNIDPQGQASDQEIWTALNKASLTQYIKNLPRQLQTQVSSCSQSFSMGQKQLLSLTRVLLFRKKFLVLDEATSNVDMKTDAFIQKAIRRQFRDTTIITVAHRLNTVADYDKIIVMHQGKIIEEGPYEELVSKRGAFYEMVQKYGKNIQYEE